MANPHIKWTQPLNSPATVDDPHILRNDLVTISRKAPSSPAIPGVTAGAYYAQFNDVVRTDFEKKIGGALKVLDGNNRAIPSIAMEVFLKLNLLNENEKISSTLLAMT